MPEHATITRLQVDEPTVFAFVICAEVSRDDMKTMAKIMNSAFDTYESVSMLLIFADYDGSETGAGLNAETLKSQIRSLRHVEKYAVVGAPPAAAGLINAMGALIPVDARTFDAADEEEAWRFVGARPLNPDRSHHRSPA
tara:strand:- start:107 stop:526 length:420 start_codon:yes stop_codon:yes gene_type:complete